MSFKPLIVKWVEELAAEERRAEGLVVVAVRDVYGKPTVYPVNKTAWVFADLTGKKTLSQADLSKIEELGFKIETQKREAK